MSKIVDLENAKLYKITRTLSRKNGSVISSMVIYVWALSPSDAMCYVTVSLEGGIYRIEIEEIDGLIDSKLFIKSDKS